MTSKNKYGVGIFELLTITFVVLKLTGTIDWTWWQVFSPAIIALFAGVIDGIVEGFIEAYQKNKKN